MANHAFEIGPIRPPSEAGSLLLQVTRGCTWNKCKFCGLYRGTQFKIHSLEEIKAAIDSIVYFKERLLSLADSAGNLNYSQVYEDMAAFTSEEQECYYMVLNWQANGGKTVFLQDGNTVALAPHKLAEALRYLKERLPEIQRITSYGRAETLARIAVEQFIELREAGLTRIHSGFESGSDAVLKLIDKGVTAQQEIQCGQRIKTAGIELSVYFMPGIGGRRLSEENAKGTAEVVSAINPDFIRLRTAVVKPGTDLWAEEQAGRFEPASDMEKLDEIRLLIENIQGCNGYLKSDHIINLLFQVEGRLDRDKTAMLAAIGQLQRLPEEERKLFQLARRMGAVTEPDDLAGISPEEKEKLLATVRKVQEPKDWERLLNQYLMRYI